MLEFLRGKTSDRKLRLFGCACCRRAWESMGDARSKKAVETAEDYAEGRITDDQLFLVGKAALSALDVNITDPEWQTPDWRGKWHPLFARWAAVMATVKNGPDEIGGGVILIAKDIVKAIGPGESDFQARLARDIFGTPFRPRRPIDPLLLTWRDALIPKTARAAYDNREMPSGTLEPVRLAALSSLLEEAGCNDTGLLRHLRSPEPHVRGCWAIDAILNRK